MWKKHLQLFIVRKLRVAESRHPAVRLRADAVDPADALFHRGWSSGDAVMISRAESVEILSFLQQVGADER
jgi:hypothetical protein